QKAVVSALKANPALMARVTGVFDKVPSDQRFPYVTLGSLFETEADTHTTRGLLASVTLHVWSEYEGNREAAEILEALDAVLDRQPLSVPGWTHVSVARESADTVPDPNPDI